MPSFGRSWPPTLNPPRICPAEFQDPSSNCLIREVETTLGKQVLNVPIAQRETAIQPDGMLDDDRRKAVTTVRYLAHSETLKHRPCRSHGVNVTMPAASLAKAQGKLPGAIEETVRGAHVSTVDWRTLLRRYMTDATNRDTAGACPTGASSTAGRKALSAVDPFGGHRHDRRHRRHLGLAAGRDAGGVLGRDQRDRDRTSAGERHPPAGRRRGAGRRRIRRRRPARRDRHQGQGRNRLPTGLRLARRARHPARRLPLPH